MTLQIQSDHVYTQLGVAISVTGIAQVRPTKRNRRPNKALDKFHFRTYISQCYIHVASYPG